MALATCYRTVVMLKKRTSVTILDQSTGIKKVGRGVGMGEGIFLKGYLNARIYRPCTVLGFYRFDLDFPLCFSYHAEMHFSRKGGGVKGG